MGTYNIFNSMVIYPNRNDNLYNPRWRLMAPNAISKIELSSTGNSILTDMITTQYPCVLQVVYFEWEKFSWSLLVVRFS